MKQIVCLWGGPGTGKSTTAAGLFNKLKKENFNVEINTEYIKNWVWEKRNPKPGDQVYIFAKQSRKERILMENNLDFIITDSPMALSIFYGEKYDKYEKEFKPCRLLLKQHHKVCLDNGYKIEHYFLQRQKKYNPKGRYQTEDEAIIFDTEILNLLKELGINYKSIVCDINVESSIIKDLLKIKD